MFLTKSLGFTSQYRQERIMRQPQRLSLESLETRLAPALAIYGVGFVPKPAMTVQAITVVSSFQQIMKIDYGSARIAGSADPGGDGI